MIGKRVQFDDETWAVINLMRQNQRRSFRQLAIEAFADLLDDGHYGLMKDADMPQQPGPF